MQLAFKILKITAVSHTSVIPGLGGRGRKIGNSKSSLIHITFKASLGYTIPCFNIIKKTTHEACNKPTGLFRGGNHGYERVTGGVF